MIPKKLFFIWIGKDKPKFVDFVVNIFKEVNPDFDVKLIHETIENPSLDFSFILECYLHTNKKETEESKIIKKLFSICCRRDLYFRKSLDTKAYSMLCNAYRFYILRKYGGLYIDCDTFPVKPFDDKILNNKMIKSFYDIYFLGCEINTPLYFTKDKNYKDRKDVKMYPYKSKNIKWTNDQKQKFLNCNLKYKLDNSLPDDYYFHHFEVRSWK